ncbi:MAG: hypothetical protein VW268_09540 [Rhodospirillaceae bacterium]
MKSLSVGVGTTVFIIGGLAGIGVWISSEPSVLEASTVKPDGKTYTVRMNPHQVQLGGYGLKSSGKDKLQTMLVSVELTVKGAHNQQKLCRLMPHLVSTLNTAFASLVSAGGGAHLDGNLGNTLRTRFNKALGGDMVTAVSLRTYAEGGKVPQTTCDEQA